MLFFLRFPACAIVFVLSTSVLLAQAPQAPVEPLTIEAAFARALTSNPTIAAGRLRRTVDLAGIGVASDRLNPEVHAEFEKETPKQSFGLAVPLELGGKRGGRVAVAEATVRVGEAELAQTIIDIRTQVRRVYFSRLVAEARLGVLDELRQFAIRARDAAQARFDVGSAPRLELLQAQLALAQAEIEATAAQATSRAAGVQLNALLGYPLDAQVSLATGLDSPIAIAPPVALARAQASNAELALLDRQIEEHRARLGLAQAMQKPEVTPDFTFTRNSLPEFMYGWRLAAAVTIPVFTNHRAGVQLEEATLAQLTAQREALMARVTSEVTSASARADAQRAAYVRYQSEILPQALEVERMAEDSYRLGQTGIAALLQALQASRDMRLRSLQTASDFQEALGELERVIGAPIP